MAFRECFDHYAFQLKHGQTTCMDCGHTWTTDEDADKCVCPKCKGKVGSSAHQNDRRQCLLPISVLTERKGLQLMRAYQMKAYYRKGQKATFIVGRWHAIGWTRKARWRLWHASAQWVSIWTRSATTPTLNCARTTPPISILLHFRSAPIWKLFLRYGATALTDVSRHRTAYIVQGDADRPPHRNDDETMSLRTRPPLHRPPTALGNLLECLQDSQPQPLPYYRHRQMGGLHLYVGRNGQGHQKSTLHLSRQPWSRARQNIRRKSEPRKKRSAPRRRYARHWRTRTKFKEMKSRFFGLMFTDGNIVVRMLESVRGARSWGQGDAPLRRQRYKLFTQSWLHHLLCKNSRTRVETVEFSRTDESRTMPRTTEQGHRAPCRHHQLGEQQCKTYRATNGCNDMKSISAERWKFGSFRHFLSWAEERKRKWQRNCLFLICDACKEQRTAPNQRTVLFYKTLFYGVNKSRYSIFLLRSMEGTIFHSTFWSPHNHDRCFCCHFASWHTSGFSSPFHIPHCRQSAAKEQESRPKPRNMAQSFLRSERSKASACRSVIFGENRSPGATACAHIRHKDGASVHADPRTFWCRRQPTQNVTHDELALSPLRLGRQAARHKKQG